jgi:hypothetical protein
MENENEILFYFIFGIFILQRTSLFRFLKDLLIPSIVGIIVYRIFFATDTKSFLEFVLDFIKSFENGHLLKLIGDILGVFLILKLLDVFTNFNIFEFSFKKNIIGSGYELVKNLSFVKKIMDKERLKLENELEKDLKVKSRQISTNLKKMPLKGTNHNEILDLMKTVTSTEDIIWETGRVSGSVYHGKREHQNLLNQAFCMYSLSNPLHPEVWPSLMKFESEIIAMTASLVDGNIDTVCGATTSVFLFFYLNLITVYKIYIYLVYKI